MKRICIYPKDIARITGKSYRQSLRTYNCIKVKLGKEKSQEVSTAELADYIGLPISEIERVI